MWIISLIAFFVFATSLHVFAETEPEPSFISKEGVHQAMLGQTIDLPCEVANLGDFTVLWSKEGYTDNGDTIFAERTKMIQDERFEYATKDEDPMNWTIRISQIEGFDQGVYRCVISTYPEQMSQKQILSVKVPPSVNIVPEKSPQSFEAGSHIQLTCYPSGNPLPTIVWTRLGAPLPDGSASHVGSELHIENASSKHDGTYKCIANNSVGEPAEAEIKIQVIPEGGQKHAPKVNASLNTIYVKVDGAFNVTCSYTASPLPTVEWFRDNYPIELNSAKNANRIKISFEEKDGRTVTTITNSRVTVEDFGDYKCKIENTLGSAEATTRVTGYPGVAQLNVIQITDGVLLEWSLDSPEPITEYKVDYRKIGDKDFQNVTIKSDDVQEYANDGITYKGQYPLKGLESETDYEVSFVAKNRHGSGDLPREMYHFKTGKIVRKSENMGEREKDSAQPKVKDTPDDKKGAASYPVASFRALLLASICYLVFSFVIHS